MKDAPTLLRTETIYRGRKLTLEREELRQPSGTGTIFEVVRHPGAVVILPLHADGSLVAIRQYRRAVGREILEFPAGTLEPGEDPAACAARELVEEIGFAAGVWTPLGELFPAPGFCDERQHLFLARDLTPARAEADDDEIIEPVTFSPAEVEKLIATGGMVDAKSIAIFCRARLLKLL